MTIDITCPTCGTESFFEEVGRDAAAFCRVCDYPLFWVNTVKLGVQSGELGDTGLRRLPGTAGRIAVAMLACPNCTEPNPVTASICIRCGADLHPVPPVVVVPLPPPPAPPPPPPPPPKRVIWPWIVLGVLAVIAVVLLIVLLA
jgi:hypothetical protein